MSTNKKPPRAVTPTYIKPSATQRQELQALIQAIQEHIEETGEVVRGLTDYSQRLKNCQTANANFIQELQQSIPFKEKSELLKELQLYPDIFATLKPGAQQQFKPRKPGR